MIDASPIAAIFERFTTGYHFYLRDLRSGESVELGQSGAWPIGSCFKLAVLVAYFEALADGFIPPDSLDSENLIAPSEFSIGVGVINLLDSPIRLTDRHLLHWMLAASDGTATDILIGKLGLDRVRATLSRLAPASTLTCNLNDMVERFRVIPGALDCKTRQWTEAEALAFRLETCRLGQTNAVDLAKLALEAFTFAPPRRTAEGHDARVMEFSRLLAAPRAPFRRAEMFANPPIRHFAKTGSIGRNYFTAEGGVILEGDAPVASFGYCTQGWRLPAFVVETICGLVGLEMARAVGLDPDPNWDWTPEGAQLLLGDLSGLVPEPHPSTQPSFP